MKFWEKAHREGVYKNWLSVEEKKPFLEEVLKLVKKNDNSNLKALDIGCSTGDYSIRLAKAGFQTTGIDISEKAIQIAFEKSKDKDNLYFEICDVLSYTPKTKNFNLIVDFSCFTHLRKKYWSDYLNNLYSWLDQEGVAIFSLWSKNSTKVYGINPSQRNNNFYVKKTELGSFYNYFFTKETVRSTFEKYFHIIKLEEKTLDSFKGIQPDSDLKQFFVILKKKTD